MDSSFEDAFDESIFCLLPVPREDGMPDDWKLVLVNEACRHENIATEHT